MKKLILLFAILAGFVGNSQTFDFDCSEGKHRIVVNSVYLDSVTVGNNHFEKDGNQFYIDLIPAKYKIVRWLDGFFLNEDVVVYGDMEISSRLVTAEWIPNEYQGPVKSLTKVDDGMTTVFDGDWPVVESVDSLHINKYVYHLNGNAQLNPHKAYEFTSINGASYPVFDKGLYNDNLRATSSTENITFNAETSWIRDGVVEDPFSFSINQYLISFKKSTYDSISVVRGVIKRTHNKCTDYTTICGVEEILPDVINLKSKTINGVDYEYFYDNWIGKIISSSDAYTDSCGGSSSYYCFSTLVSERYIIRTFNNEVQDILDPQSGAYIPTNVVVKDSILLAPSVYSSTKGNSATNHYNYEFE